MEPTTRLRPGRLGPAWMPAVAAGGVLVAGCAVAGIVDPSGGPTLCPFKAVTGLDCPGCGATRALHFAMRGDIVTAAGFNLLFVLALPFLMLTGFVELTRLFGGTWSSPVRSLSPRVTWVLVVIVGVFWILRNLPFAPFNWLGTGT